MISRASFDAYCSDVESLKTRATEVVEKAVGAWLRANPDAGVSEVREGIKDMLASIVESFDGAAATIAAEWYDESAELAHAKLPSAVTEIAYAPEQVDATVRYQVRKLIEGDRAGFATACADLVRDQVARSVNETVMANAKRDRKHGVRFARIATGSETCAFCYMLASRGAVYHNRKTAGEFKHFHRHCDCKVVPGFEDDPLAVLVEGHDPSVMADRMYEIEQQTGLSFANKSDLSRISEYMAMLDRGWLYDGDDVVVSYPDDQTKLEIERDRPWEKAAAETLARNGFAARFVVDRREYVDPDDGLLKFIGLPDLEGGVELKSLIRAKSVSAVDRHLRDASGKEGLFACVIDNQSGILPDSDVRAAIREKMGKRHVRRVVFITSAGEIEYIVK